ncbi:uncharacterized protein ACA1_230310 [Acanthamoeba castellanii str. Neff]|uniref:PAS fold domain-containing protein n=1 Tax=Acanthamoeba castellanii (strain ATCC 30010 / Neff) TaxID=1257118 RepID=L8HBA3_ACACF|nr:uncharacterized protein ACA1_230310 [Acanthamoeba castellanii str. Neff]ELR21656.1 hypothetical protein ACA1_230310 [Acanthamoeba castellanii str. Neff]
MQDMQRSVGAMKHDVLQLSAAQASMSYAQNDMRHALETLPLAMTIGHALQKCSLSRSRPLTSSSSSFSWSSSSSSSSSTSPRSALTTFTSFDGSRLASLFPFLADFRLHQRNVPFAIDDVSKPMGAICPIEKPPKKGGKPRDLWHPPRRKPVLALFNQAFCDMLQYQAHELQGSSIAHFMLPDPDPEVQHQFMTRMMARTFGDVGDVVPISPRMRTKDGRLIRAEVKHQSFFSAEGRRQAGTSCLQTSGHSSKMAITITITILIILTTILLIAIILIIILITIILIIILIIILTITILILFTILLLIIAKGMCHASSSNGVTAAVPRWKRNRSRAWTTKPYWQRCSRRAWGSTSRRTHEKPSRQRWHTVP